jgi:hypothetical protein
VERSQVSVADQEYEKRGGGYKGDKGESQKNLEKWTDEEWQTQEGDSRARERRRDERYLPRRRPGRR